MSKDISSTSLRSELRNAIAAMTPGERLPTSRALVARYQVSPVTVSRVLSDLAAEGLVITRPGSGSYVARPTRASTSPPDYSWQAIALGDRTIDTLGIDSYFAPIGDGAVRLNGGYPDPTLRPEAALRQVASRVARRADIWQQAPVRGIEGLRGWFASNAGPDFSARDVLITGGGQSAIGMILRALAPAGAPVLVESPTYPGVLAVARAAGLRPIPVPADADGVIPDLLAESFAMTGSRMFYCQPLFRNPTGANLSADRREAVLQIARAAGAFVIEDDYVRHLSIEQPPRPLVSIDGHGCVVHVASLTKATSPNLRVAGVIARGPAARRLAAAALLDNFFVSRALQEIALELVTSAAWRRHVAALPAALRQRRDALMSALARHVPRVTPQSLPTGGVHLWAALPTGVDDAALARAAARHGVLVSPGHDFFPAEPPAAYLRLSYGGATQAELALGAELLASALAEVTDADEAGSSPDNRT